MSRGEPGLPAGFTWREREYRIVSRLARGKTTDSSEGEAYVRRHTWRLGMDDGAVWNVYFLRQPPKGSRRSAKVPRWFLLSVEPEAGPS